MFTGIVTGVGTVRALSPIGHGTDMRLVIGTPWVDVAIPIGASIACAGCCLTAVAVGADWFAVDASAETLSKTTLGSWRPGSRMNLERPLRVGDELGGHIVAGHVDGVECTHPCCRQPNRPARRHFRAADGDYMVSHQYRPGRLRWFLS